MKEGFGFGYRLVVIGHHGQNFEYGEKFEDGDILGMVFNLIDVISLFII